jgi:hypothetical protein
VASLNLVIFQSTIYLHLAQHETTQAVLTMILFVSIIQLRPRPTEDLSYLFDSFFCHREELFADHVKYDASQYADCERNCKAVPTGRIGKVG